MKQHPEYVVVAVNWWANVISDPKQEFFDKMPKLLRIVTTAYKKNYSEEELSIFKENLAEEIIRQIQCVGKCVLSVNNEPCKALIAAGEKIGVPTMVAYPWNTWMRITDEEVRVFVGHRNEAETIWLKEIK